MSYVKVNADWIDKDSPGAQPFTSVAVEQIEEGIFTAHVAVDVTDATIRWDGTGNQPLRAVATSDLTRPVRWRQPTPPPTTTGYAIAGRDVWEQTP